MANGMADDLPRTLRREREARGLDRAPDRGLDRGPERGNERGAQRGSGNPAFAAAPTIQASDAASFVPQPARGEHVLMQGNTVTDVRIPFFRMMAFCFKLVFAAIPALILLGCFIWLAGHLLMTYAPWLVKLQILIRVPT